MAYDQESFLAGVAAGRNMRSWPKMDWSDSEDLLFTVWIDPVQTSMFYVFQTYLVNGTIDWGDGTVDTKQQRQLLRSTHTYAVPGIYQIRIHGILLAVKWSQLVLDPSDQASLDCLISIDTPIPEIPEAYRPYVVWGTQSSGGMFEGARNLVSIPPDLYRAYTREGVYAVVGANMFWGCESLPAIPKHLFRDVNFRGRRQGGELRPPQVQGWFGYCKSLTTIPDDLFRNPCFEETGGVSSLFAGCENLKNFPDDLFLNFPSARAFVGTFEGCVSITKRVPELWNLYPDATEHYHCFYGCVNAANYAAIPADWGGPGSD